MKKTIFLLFLLCTVTQLSSQQNNSLIDPFFLNGYWTASWITHPTADLKAYGVYHFRKVIELSVKPDKFVIHVSADNRYQLMVNGTPVCFGPARSDLTHWNFETLDIAKYLNAGRNILAAVVWNFGDQIPAAQMTNRTAFLLQGNSETEKTADTNFSWKVTKDEAYSAIPVDNVKLRTYLSVGPGDCVDGEIYPWNWQKISFDDSSWSSAKMLAKAHAKGIGTETDWDLIPREIPFMEESVQRFKSIRRQQGCQASEAFLQGTSTLTIPAHTSAVMLLDQGVETTGYPEITVSGSKGSEIEAIYAEALFDKDGVKGNRNDIQGKTIKGITDKFIVGNIENETFRPLWFRTFRYVELNIKTGNNPLAIKNIQTVFTAYPFKENATFKSSDPELTKIWDTGWRTLRLCSNETHFDCPYYEQMQYVGDTRIQCLISGTVSGDDLLTRNAINLFDRSRFHEGLTCSRYPSSVMQVIPPFSLFWTNMIHDFWLMNIDSAFVRPMLPGIEGVFNWFENHLDAKTGILGQTPYWNFVDWPDQWAWDSKINSGGVPKGGTEGGSSILTLQFAYALNDAAELFSFFGKESLAAHYRGLARSISKATIDKCWDKNRQLVADSPEKLVFSQHANIMAVLANAELPVDKKELMNRVVVEPTLIQATIYYRFYLFRAMKKAGLGDRYTEMLGPWKDMLKLGLSTFSERYDPTRSDCHAWSASPVYELLATVCGIEPAEAGFKSVKIEPHLGTLKWVEGSIPHPKGTIKVHFKQSKSGMLSGEITLPSGLKGTCVFKNKIIVLNEGINHVHE